MRQSKPVIVRDGFSGAFIILYYSISEACKQLQISNYTLNKYINSGAKFNRKYLNWYYKDDNTAVPDLMFPIVQKENGKIINQFKTISEAADKLNLGRNVVARYIKNGTHDCWNCTWENLKKPL